MRNVRHLIALAAMVAASASCGSLAQQGRAPVYLVIDSLVGQRGGQASGTFGVPVPSDVLTNVTTP